MEEEKMKEGRMPGIGESEVKEIIGEKNGGSREKGGREGALS
jgi:hypothetical protein